MKNLTKSDIEYLCAAPGAAVYYVDGELKIGHYDEKKTALLTHIDMPKEWRPEHQGYVPEDVSDYIVDIMSKLEKKVNK